MGQSWKIEIEIKKSERIAGFFVGQEYFLQPSYSHRYGRNLAQFEFELVEEIKTDTSKVNAARRLNLVKANEVRHHVMLDQ